MTLPYGPPLPVSPLIRGARWALLLAGFIYAQGKYKMYSIIENRHRRAEAERKIHRDKEMEKMKARIAAEEKEAVKLLEQGKLF